MRSQLKRTAKPGGFRKAEYNNITEKINHPNKVSLTSPEPESANATMHESNALVVCIRENEAWTNNHSPNL